MFNLSFSVKSVERAIFINSIPKSGTNLAIGVFGATLRWKIAVKRGFRPWLFKSEHKLNHCLASLDAGKLYHGHLEYSVGRLRALKRSSAIIIFIHRDLKDVVLSHWKYVKYMDKKHRYWKDKIGDNENLIKRIIDGDSEQPGLKKIYNSYMQWMNHEGVIAIGFEELIKWKSSGRCPEPLNHLKLDLKRHKFINKYSQTDSRSILVNREEILEVKELIKKYLV